MNTKILTILALIFLLVTPMIQARTIVWTDISDSTSLDFTITQSSDDEDNNNYDDEDYEEECHNHIIIEDESTPQITYSDWTCMNNRLQRTVTREGSTTTEFGGICGIELSAKEKPTNLFIIMPFILLVLILITLIAIVIIFLIRK